MPLCSQSGLILGERTTHVLPAERAGSHRDQQDVGRIALDRRIFSCPGPLMHGASRFNEWIVAFLSGNKGEFSTVVSDANVEVKVRWSRCSYRGLA